MSTIAKSDPLITSALLMARPSPLAPPVITAVFPVSEKKGNVGLKAGAAVCAFSRPLLDIVPAPIGPSTCDTFWSFA